MKKPETLNEMINFLIDEVGINTQFVYQTLDIFGYKEENLILLLSYFTGYNSFEQYIEYAEV